MEIAFIWMPLVLAGLVVLASGVLALVLVIRRIRRSARAVPVAHTERLTALPGYRRLLRRYRLMLLASLLLVVIAAGASGLLASRPVDASVQSPDRFNRDIVLCLDVSGSMLDYDSDLIGQFQELAKQFAGERISLVMWNSSSVQVFPLTDDYGYLTDQLAVVKESMDRELAGDYETTGYTYYYGTELGEGASLIGDGLASCVLRFDRLDSQRSRTIVLATDNLMNGEQLVTFKEAADFATDRGVRVYGINPAGSYAPDEAEEFKTLALSTDGGYFSLDDAGAVASIANDVLAEQATHFTGAPELVYADIPGLPLLVLVIAFAGILVLAWRVRS